MTEGYTAFNPSRLRKLGNIGAAIFLSTSMTSAPQLDPSGFTQGECDPILWQHISSPDRLQIIEPCKIVNGKITDVQEMEDGDYHVLLNLDKGNEDITNDPRFQGNIKFQGGNLVTEPICEHEVISFEVAKNGVCDNFHQDFNPQAGEHVEITGSYVFDTNHGWLEIHPITHMQKK